MDDWERRRDQQFHRDGARKDGLGQVAAAALAGPDVDHRDANCHRDLKFPATDRDYQRASGAKVDQLAEEQLRGGQGPKSQLAAVWLPGEQILRDELLHRERKRLGARQKAA